jgi:hypothetical protein
VWLLAESAPSDSRTAIILAVIGLTTGVVVAVVTGVFALLTARTNRDAATVAAPVTLPVEHGLYERVAVLERRADDADDRFDRHERTRHRDD